MRACGASTSIAHRRGARASPPRGGTPSWEATYRSATGPTRHSPLASRKPTELAAVALASLAMAASVSSVCIHAAVPVRILEYSMNLLPLLPSHADPCLMRHGQQNVQSVDGNVRRNIALGRRDGAAGSAADGSRELSKVCLGQPRSSPAFLVKRRSWHGEPPHMATSALTPERQAQAAACKRKDWQRYPGSPGNPKGIPHAPRQRHRAHTTRVSGHEQPPFSSGTQQGNNLR